MRGAVVGAADCDCDCDCLSLISRSIPRFSIPRFSILVSRSHYHLVRRYSRPCGWGVGREKSACESESICLGSALLIVSSNLLVANARDFCRCQSQLSTLNSHCQSCCRVASLRTCFCVRLSLARSLQRDVFKLNEFFRVFSYWILSIFSPLRWPRIKNCASHWQRGGKQKYLLPTRPPSFSSLFCVRFHLDSG